jgi:hypothetical protein
MEWRPFVSQNLNHARTTIFLSINAHGYGILLERESQVALGHALIVSLSLKAPLNFSAVVVVRVSFKMGWD